MRSAQLTTFLSMAAVALLSTACDLEVPGIGTGGDASVGDGSANGDPIACTADAKLCDDGSAVGRDPDNGCAFKPCPDEVACPEDARLCPNGTSVVRDPANDCQFPACPEPVVCTAEAKECPDGSYVSREPERDCMFAPCPGECVNPLTGETATEVQCLVDPCSVTTCDAHPDATCSANYCGGCHAIFTDEAGDEVTDCAPVACDTDVKECANGSYVSRDPENGCAFELCPGECTDPTTGQASVIVDCFADPCSVTSCAAHPDATCTANYCGGCHAIFTDASGSEVSCELTGCTDDAKQCPDGSWVSRDDHNGCAFAPCPGETVFCTADAKQCPDGSWVSRDGANGCAFAPCPGE